MSSKKDCLPSKVVFHKKLSFIKGCLPSKVVFHQRSSSIKGRLPSKAVFHQRNSSKLSSIKGCLSSKFVFYQRSSFIKGCLPSKLTSFCKILTRFFLFLLLLWQGLKQSQLQVYTCLRTILPAWSLIFPVSDFIWLLLNILVWNISIYTNKNNKDYNIMTVYVSNKHGLQNATLPLE